MEESILIWLLYAHIVFGFLNFILGIIITLIQFKGIKRSDKSGLVITLRVIFYFVKDIMVSIIPILNIIGIFIQIEIILDEL